MSPQEKRVTLLSVEDIDDARTYTIPQSAGVLNWGSEYIRRLIRAGRITAFKPNGQYRISGRELKRILGGIQATGRVPHNPRSDAADEILVSEETTAKLFPGEKLQETAVKVEEPIGFRHLFRELDN